MSKAARVAGLMVLIVMLLPALSSPGNTVTREEIRSALESARKDLQANSAMEKRVAADLEKLRHSGDASAPAVTDYKRYLNQVRAMVSENEKLVAQLEALLAKAELQASSSTVERKSSDPDVAAMVDPRIPEEGAVDEVEALDREIDDSLRAFDDLLLKELELLKAASAPKMKDISETAAEVAQRLREKGFKIDTDDPASTTEAEATSSKTGKSPPGGTTQPAPQGGTVMSDTGPGGSRQGTDGVPREHQERYDSSDDDIVARQLREAAEQETDPELKAKLWKEYETYKRSME